MRVVIAGGTGLIGRELIKLLHEHYDIAVLSRKLTSQPVFPESVKIIPWNPNAEEDQVDGIDGAYAVINLAGESLAGEKFFPAHWDIKRKQSILQSRLQAGKTLARAVKQAHQAPSVLIQASAIGYYGVHQDEPLDESSPAGSDFLAGICPAWESSTAEVESKGVRRVVIRSGVVLSAAGGAFPRLVLPYRFFLGGPMGNGRQVISWIHVRDEARAIQFLMEQETARGAYNLTSPQPLSNREFGKALGRILRRPSLIPLPGFMLRFLFGEVSTVVLDGQRVLPCRLKDAGFTFQFPEIEPALIDLLKTTS